MASLVEKLRKSLEVRGEYVAMANLPNYFFAMFPAKWKVFRERAQRDGRAGPSLIVYQTKSGDPRDHYAVPYSVFHELLTESTISHEKKTGAPRWNFVIEDEQLKVMHRKERINISEYYGVPLIVENGDKVQLIDVVKNDLSDKEIDLAIQEDRLLITDVATGDSVALVRQRKGQDRLRRMTLKNYKSRCALCDVATPSLLIASHILPWSGFVKQRGLQSNVICLCKFHDALFEAGYWSLGDDYEVLIKQNVACRTIALLLGENLRFQKPRKELPQPKYLSHHRKRFGF